MSNVKKNNGAEVAPKESYNGPVTAKEKAEFEVFRNGSLPRETIAKWLRNDLESIMSMASTLRNEERVFNSIVDHFFEKYRSLHVGKEDEHGS